MIRAYTGNARHSVYQEYQGAINKHYQNAARLSEFSRQTESPYSRYNSSCDYWLSSSSPSTGDNRVSPHRTPTLSSIRSPVIVPEMKVNRAMVSRLGCSLAIHSGLGSTSGEPNFLPVIPVRYREPTTTDCAKRKFSKAKSTTNKNKQDFEKDLKESHNAPISQTLVSLTDHCKGCKGAFSKVKNKKREKKKVTGRVKPDLKPLKDVGSFRPVGSKYLMN